MNNNFGWSILGSFLLCFFAGYFADQQLNTGYCWTLVGLGLAFVYLAYEIWKAMKNN